MIHGLRIKDGKATYVSRFVKTSKLKQEEFFGGAKFAKVYGQKMNRTIPTGLVLFIGILITLHYHEPVNSSRHWIDFVSVELGARALFQAQSMLSSPASLISLSPFTA